MPEIILTGEPMAMFVADYVGKLENVEKFTRAVKVEYIKSLHIKTISISCRLFFMHEGLA